VATTTPALAHPVHSLAAMAAFDNFLKSQGYVKLDQYGLVLTPDDRIMSTRPAVLDDGLGNKIVGWTEGDLAAMELERHGESRKPAAPAKLPAKLPAAPARPMRTTMPPVPVAQVAAPAPVPRQTAPMPIVPSAAFVPVEPIAPATMIAKGTPDPFPVAPIARPTAPMPVASPQVAAQPVVEEDEWEWEIAMARARAAADDVSTAATVMGFTKPTAPLPRAPRPTAPMAAMAQKPATATPKPEPKPSPMASRTMQMPAVAAHTDPTKKWPKSEPVTETYGESIPSIEKPIGVQKRTTVIPVPSLPVAANPADIRPVTHSRTVAAPPRTRMARGTAREDTIQLQVAPPRAHTDETSPYITLPPEVKPSGYAHANTKRVASKQR
jgi:hypothetical protein